MLFDNLVNDYENLFERHPKIYEEEIKTIKKLLPKGKGIEIGVGTGRFATPFSIKFGIEPSKKMAEIAKKRGIEVVNKLAEEMVFENKFDFALLVTTICFVKDPLKTLQNTYKALKKEGFIIVAFVDLNSPLGRFYEKNKEKSKFYKEAKFFTKDEIIELLKTVGFSDFKCVENLYGENLENLTFQINSSCNGGAFKVIRGKK